MLEFNTNTLRNDHPCKCCGQDKLQAHIEYCDACIASMIEDADDFLASSTNQQFPISEYIPF